MNQAAPQLRVPESMGPKELGSYMRGLREHFKLSPQDVSERLHIRMRYVTAIEEANYDAMPGKIYARGYVQTYAEFLGLDAEQVVKQCFPAEEVKTAPISIATPKPEIKPAAVSRTWVKSRVCLPSPKISAGRPQSARTIVRGITSPLSPSKWLLGP